MVCLVSAVMAVLFASTANAGVRVRAAANASGFTPFAPDCNPTTPATGLTYLPRAREVDIAVDPLDPSNQIVAWIDGDFSNILTSYTTDGGNHWTVSAPPGLTPCSGGTNPAIEGAADPALSFAPDGTAYLGTLEWSNGYIPPYEDYTEYLYAQSSTDGGATWSAPVSVRTPDTQIADKDSVFADTQRPGYLYAAYMNNGAGLVPLPRGEGQLLFSRSTDGGNTWTTTVLQSTGSADTFPINSQLSETADGTLVYTYQDVARNLMAIHSTDAGTTWSAPVQVTPKVSVGTPNVCGVRIGNHTYTNHTAVVDGQTTYVAQVDNGSSGAGPGKIVLSKSSDGGQTWTTSVAVASPHQIVLAAIAANKRGQLGLGYIDLDAGSATCTGTQPAIPASARVRVSNDGGSSWSDPQLIGAPAWDINSGSLAGGLGDYMGIAATPSGFAVATVQGQPLTNASPPVPITGDSSVVVGEVVSSNGR
jgi:hypothetical protein